MTDRRSTEGHAIASQRGRRVAAANRLMPNSLKFACNQKLYAEALSRAAIM